MDEYFEIFESIIAKIDSDDLIESEADTRCKIIDEVLTKVLSWPSENLSREDYVDGEKSGYTDYILRIRDRKLIVLEAKRIGIHFELPSNQLHKRLKISTLLAQKGSLSDAIIQARNYCDELGIRYCVISNGYCWIIFRALRDDLPWKQGKARIFYSFLNIREHFFEFMDLLSFTSLNKYQIDSEFNSISNVKKSNKRVLDMLYSPDAPLDRNRLHADIDYLITTYFKDITSDEDPKLLEECYIYSKPISGYISNIGQILKARIPSFYRNEKSIELLTGKKHSGKFQAEITRKIDNDYSEVLLILGSIGSGKTTFIKRFFRLTDQSLLSRINWFYIDFLSSPPESDKVEAYVYESILNQIRSDYRSEYLENRKNIKKAFQDKLEILNETKIKVLNLSQDEYEKEISPYLELWQNDIVDYTKHILSLFKRRGKSIIVAIDNVDQLPQELQTSIFLTSQYITKEIGCITFLSLREETFYTARSQNIFTAYTNQKFHISSPDFLRVVGKRISFVRNLIEKGDQSLSSILDKESIAIFLKIIEDSIFNNNRYINKFIHSICFGNIRLALDYFSLFLVSGATDVNKMLRIYERDGSYTIAFHEFVKAIMLGERKYYKAFSSKIINIFNFTSKTNSSHFTAIRILKFLYRRMSFSSSEGKGYTNLDEMLFIFDDVFNNREDVIEWCNNLLRKKLIEVNTHSSHSIQNATNIRITSSGWYYLRYLSLKFVYLDLTLFDTPIEDDSVLDSIFRITINIERLGDLEESKIGKTKLRFQRVDMILDYLKQQENIENKLYPDKLYNEDFNDNIMETYISIYEHDKHWILSRLNENHQKYEEFYISDEYEEAVQDESNIFIEN